MGSQGIRWRSALQTKHHDFSHRSTAQGSCSLGLRPREAGWRRVPISAPKIPLPPHKKQSILKNPGTSSRSESRTKVRPSKNAAEDRHTPRTKKHGTPKKSRFVKRVLLWNCFCVKSQVPCLSLGVKKKQCRAITRVEFVLSIAWSQTLGHGATPPETQKCYQMRPLCHQIQMTNGWAEHKGNDKHYFKKYSLEKLKHEWIRDRRGKTLKGKSNVSRHYKSKRYQKINTRRIK